jgi:hypothetical protein
MNSKSLYQLVKSLNQSEKRCFSLHANKYSNGNNSYTDLFDILVKQEKYDETEVKKRFSVKRNISNFSSDKKYLYNTILDSLCNFYDEETSIGKVNKMIRQARVLFRKNLTDQGITHLLKAKKFAWKYEQFIHLLDIISLEKDIYSRDYFKNMEEIENLLEEEERVLDLIKNENQYRALSFSLYSRISNKTRIRSEEDLAEYNKYFTHPFLVSEENARTIASKMFFNNITCSLNYITFNYTQALHHSGKLLDIFTKNPHIVKEKPMRYAVSLRNHLLFMVNEGSGDFISTIKKFEYLKNEYPGAFFSDLRQYVTQHSFNLRILHAVATHDIKEALQLSDAFHKFYIEEKNSIDKPLELLTINSISVAYLLANQPAKALHYLNLNLQNPALLKSTTLHSFSRIFNLVLHYELKNYDLLEYLLKSTYRFLTKNGLYRFEKLILDYMRKLPGQSANNISGSFLQLADDLEKITADPFEKPMLEFFDFIKWLREKAEVV